MDDDDDFGEASCMPEFQIDHKSLRKFDALSFSSSKRLWYT
jgi:hypothetical protein